jgi:hypothetical protein
MSLVKLSIYQSMKNLIIEYSDTFYLRFRLRENAFVPRWVERVQLAQKQYPIDDPGRFYGFGTIEEQTDQSLQLINKCIETINQWQALIPKLLTEITDQDYLNFLHNIFEVHHGHLGTQDTDKWHNTPKHVQKALADLNVLVHRCESVARGAMARHVVTYYGLPKTETLIKDDYSLFEPLTQWGTVYLNYVEIGKTLEDLALDNDKWIGDDAFKPWNYYSADFNVKFWQDDRRQIALVDSKIKEYYDNNNTFFESRGYNWGDYRLVRGGLPLANINLPDIGKDFAKNHILTQLEKTQTVKSVTFE